MQEAKDASRLHNQSIGRTISEWIRLGMNSVHSEPQFEMQDGIPVIVHTGPVKPVTTDLVHKLAADE
jgi:hypothetical protein